MDYNTNRHKHTINVDSVEPDVVFEALHNEIQQGHYIVDVVHNDDKIFRVNAFANWAFYDRNVYGGWGDFCKEHHVWDDFDEKYK